MASPKVRVFVELFEAEVALPLHELGTPRYREERT